MDPTQCVASQVFVLISQNCLTEILLKIHFSQADFFTIKTMSYTGLGVLGLVKFHEFMQKRDRTQFETFYNRKLLPLKGKN